MKIEKKKVKTFFHKLRNYLWRKSKEISKETLKFEFNNATEYETNYKNQLDLYLLATLGNKIQSIMP